MVKSRDVRVPRTETETVSVTCDICKAEDENAIWLNGESEWGTADNYEFAESVVRLETGLRFPDGGESETVSFDICPKCFKEKLVPALAKLGAEPSQVEESTW